jgi:ABC-type transporter Mla subunit MlaD
MASGQDARRNTVAGLFVLSGVLLAAVTLVVIQRFTLAEQTDYTVRFSVDEGVAGLAPGSPVLVGGLARGTVTEVSPILDGEGRLERLDVRIALRADIAIFSDARVVRTMPLLGSQASLNFTRLGGIRGDASRVAAGGTIDATSSPGMLEMLVGSENSEEVGNVIGSLDRLSELLGEQVPRDYETIVRPALVQAGTVVGDFSERWPQWSDRIDGTLANADTASASLVSGLSEARSLVASARPPVDELASMIARNAPRVDEIFDNALTVSRDARVVVSDLRARTLPLLDEILGNADSTLRTIATAIDRLEPEILRQVPQIRTILENVRIASAELKLSTIEVRRNPWRLLLRPTSELVAHENLLDAARAFSIAASDLKSAGQSFEEILAADPAAFGDDPELAGSIRRNLLDELARFERVREALFRTIVESR